MHYLNYQSTSRLMKCDTFVTVDNFTIILLPLLFFCLLRQRSWRKWF